MENSNFGRYDKKAVLAVAGAEKEGRLGLDFEKVLNFLGEKRPFCAQIEDEIRIGAEIGMAHFDTATGDFVFPRQVEDHSWFRESLMEKCLV